MFFTVKVALVGTSFRLSARMLSFPQSQPMTVKIVATEESENGREARKLNGTTRITV